MYFWCKLKQQFSARSILKPLDPVMKENDCIEQYSFVLAYSKCVAISFSSHLQFTTLQADDKLMILFWFYTENKAYIHLCFWYFILLQFQKT